MTDKPTDNEIKKALECSVKDKCPECPYFHSYPCDQCRNMRKDALALINRIQAENGVYETCNARKDEAIKHLESEVKRLQAENERLTSGKCVYLSDDETTEYCVEGPCPKYKTVAEIKSEAYKEFAEKLENRILSMLTTATLEEKEIICACIGTNNNVLKELVGEDNESKN